MKQTQPKTPPPQQQDNTLHSLFKHLRSYLKDYLPHLRLETSSDNNAAEHYIKGLIQADKANIFRMEENVAESNYQNIQYFISDATWDHRVVQQLLAQETYKCLRELGQPIGLLIDESGFRKKGTMSVGVMRQWLGCIGKTDNGQVGVFAALGADRFAVPIMEQLFIPKSWAEDKERCEKAKIPDEEIRHRTKIKIAQDMVEEIDLLGVGYDFIAVDALYGQARAFMSTIDDNDKIFVGDIKNNYKVYLDDPKPYLPERKPNARGQKPKVLKTDSKSISVSKLAKKLTKDDWENIDVRHSTQGMLNVKFYRQSVWVWDANMKSAREWLLLIRKDNSDHEKTTYSYSLCNLPHDTSSQVLAEYNCARFWIEQSFRNGKQEAGMKDYQVRSWNGWHHHMTMVMMLMLFMMKTQIDLKSDIPLLTYRDLKDIINELLPKKYTGLQGIILKMEARHKMRLKDILARYKRKGQSPPHELIAAMQ